MGPQRNPGKERLQYGRGIKLSDGGPGGLAVAIAEIPCRLASDRSSAARSMRLAPQLPAKVRRR